MSLAANNGERAALILRACRDYLKDMATYLAGGRQDLPDAHSIARPFGCITEARSDGEDHFRIGTPFVAAKIDDPDAPGEERSERYFDPWHFVAILLMLLAGGRLRFTRSKYSAYYFLAYASPNGKEDHPLRRIIVNPPPESDVRQICRMPDAHYNYRRSGLKAIAKRKVRQLGQKTRSRSRTREDAVTFAIELFKRTLADHDKSDRLSGLNLSVSEYEALVRETLRAADAMQERSLQGISSAQTELVG